LNAENLPFPKNSFDLITIAFGLRNVTEKQLALESIYKALKPGGKLLILEFSKPISIMQPLYDLYSFKILPFLGELVTNDAESYRYLAESIRMHPDQDTLIGMMKNSGLERCRYQNLTGGIVALHEGYKF
jgi:demethylmenaquinone methyltransferase/2-methoxy-6-polyprenyl-1,4-benzoquinol methylase